MRSIGSGWLALFICLLAPCDVYAVDDDPAPFDPVDLETEFKADLDGDGNEESIRSFRVNPPDGSFPHAVTLIEDSKGTRQILAGQERPENIEILDLNKDGQKELLITTNGGNHYTSIAVYENKNGKYQPLFEEGSASSVIFEDTGTPLIKIGR